jgi:hypothetical protein
MHHQLRVTIHHGRWQNLASEGHSKGVIPSNSCFHDAAVEHVRLEERRVQKLQLQHQSIYSGPFTKVLRPAWRTCCVAELLTRCNAGSCSSWATLTVTVMQTCLVGHCNHPCSPDPEHQIQVKDKHLMNCKLACKLGAHVTQGYNRLRSSRLA